MLRFLIALSIASYMINAQQVNWNGQDWAQNCDFKGDDFANTLSNSDQCGGKCNANNRCTHFSWSSFNGGTCWLKSNNQVSKSNAVFQSGVVCGVISSRLIGSSNLNPSGTVRFNTINNCPYTVWVGMDGFVPGNANWQLPLGGGWQLNSGQTISVDVPSNTISGRFWGRTNCNSNSGQFRCETGDCGPFLQCNSGGIHRGGKTPVTLAEFTLVPNGQDCYDISLVDGYNLPMTMEAVNPSSGNNYWCKNPTCKLDSSCPNELKQYNSAGQVIGCYSACEKFQTDQYCCRGAFNKPGTCLASYWPVNYPAVFKNICPMAYSFAYDDAKSLFYCKNTNYNIKFC